MEEERVEILNVNTPGRSTRVLRVKYEAMRAALLNVLPAGPPGLNQEEMYHAVLPVLPQALWPDGDKAGWWAKTVQLDLEARGLVQRSRKGRPTRWWRCP